MSSWMLTSEIDRDIWSGKLTLKRLGKEKELRSSSASDYWAKAIEYAIARRSLTGLRFERASDKYDVNNYASAGFLKLDRAQRLLETWNAWGVKGKIYKKRAGGEKDGAHLPELFSQPHNNRFLQTSTSDIITDQGLRDPRGGQYVNHVWNILAGNYENECYSAPFHLFDWKNGRELMATIFGSFDDLFTSANGLLLPTVIKEQFDNGLMAIVPDIDDLSSTAKVTAWMASHPREYKAKIFDDSRVMASNDWPILDLCVLTDAHRQDFTTRQLDGMKLQFLACGPRSRPRARYLYFLYCGQLLRQAWKRRDGGIVENLPGLQKEYEAMVAWGTVGEYVGENLMRGFVKELGRQLEGSTGNEKDSDDAQGDQSSMLVEAIAEQIIVMNQTKRWEEEDGYSDSNSDEEDDEEDNLFC